MSVFMRVAGIMCPLCINIPLHRLHLQCFHEFLLQLFILVEDCMVNPLKQARDHYEHLKALEDEKKAEVNKLNK